MDTHSQLAWRYLTVPGQGSPPELKSGVHEFNPVQYSATSWETSLSEEELPQLLPDGAANCAVRTVEMTYPVGQVTGEEGDHPPLAVHSTSMVPRRVGAR